jgi:hypothetical protein
MAIRLPGAQGVAEERWRRDAVRPEELGRPVDGRQLIWIKASELDRQVAQVAQAAISPEARGCKALAVF